MGAPSGREGEGGGAGMVGGNSSIRGLKLGSTSTTPIFGISGGVTRGPREPRRNRPPREGTPPTAGGAVGRCPGGADDAGIGGSFASSKSPAATGKGAGAGAGAGAEGGADGAAASSRSFT